MLTSVDQATAALRNGRVGGVVVALLGGLSKDGRNLSLAYAPNASKKSGPPAQVTPPPR